MADEKHPAELLFETGLSRLKASSGTFYVRDPYWTHDLRLVYMPRVRYREPMYGFLIPQSARDMVTSGESVHIFQHDLSRPPTSDLPSVERIEESLLFENFARREGIYSSARFLDRRSDSPTDLPEAVMFVNFSEPGIRFDPWLMKDMNDLFRDMLRCLPSIYRNLRHASPFPVTDLLAILRPFESLTSMFHGSTSGSLETYLQGLLSAAMQVCGISEESGFGTIHLFDPSDGCLHLSTSTRNVSVESLQSSRKIRIDRRKGIVSWVAIKRSALLIQDLHLDDSHFRPIHIEVRKGTRTELAVPMTAGDELIGIFNLESTQPLRISSPFDLVRIVWYAANQAAVATRLASQAKSAQEAARYAAQNAKVTAELLEICSNVPNLGAEPYPLGPVARLASEVLKAHRCDIWEYVPDSGSFRGVGADYDGSHLDDPPRERDSGWSHFVHSRELPVWLTGICGEDAFQSFVWDDKAQAWAAPSPETTPPRTINRRLVGQEVGSELGIPIRRRLGEAPLGVAWIKYQERDRRRPEGEEMRLANAFAGEASLVLSSLRLQASQGEKSQSEGIEVIVSMLRHDMPDRFLGRVIKGIETAQDLDSFRSERKSWLDHLGILRAFIENLKLHTPKAEGEHPVLPEVNPSTVNLKDLVDRVIDLVHTVKRSPPCVNRIGEDLMCPLDPTLTSLALFALIENAKRFTPESQIGHEVSIESQPGPDGLSLVIRDHGPGMEDRLLNTIGSRSGIRRNPPGGASVSGMGFGAYLSRMLMNAQGGDVFWSRGDNDEGTVVRVRLPGGGTQ